MDGAIGEELRIFVQILDAVRWLFVVLVHEPEGAGRCGLVDFTEQVVDHLVADGRDADFLRPRELRDGARAHVGFAGAGRALDR